MAENNLCIALNQVGKSVDTPDGKLDILNNITLDVKYQEAVVIKEPLVSFTVAVVDERGLRGQTEDWKVLPVDVGDEDIILARLFKDIIQARVRVFLKPTEPGEVVLPDIVVPVAEETGAKLAVLKDKAAEV